MLTATENGYGKRTPIVEYTRHGRGTQGHDRDPDSPSATARWSARRWCDPDDEVMLISTGGVLIRTRVNAIREMSRSTQGVTLINLDEGEKLAGLERIEERDDDGNGQRQRPRSRTAATAARARRAADIAPRTRRRSRRRCTDVARIFNFSAGPGDAAGRGAARAGDEMLDWHGSGMSVMEMSHRGKEFIADRRARPRPTCASCSRSRRTTRCCSCRAARRAVRDVPMNLLRGKGKRRLRQHRRLVEEGDQGGEAATASVERRRERRGRATSPTCRRSDVEARRRTPPTSTLLQRDDRRRRVPLDARHRRRAAGGRHVVAHPVAPARRVEVTA